MDYKKLQNLTEKRNDYAGQRAKLMDDIDFKDAFTSNDISIYEEEKHLFVDSAKETFTKIIIDLENEINSMFES